MAYQNYAGAWLTQSDSNYDWLANPSTPVALTPGVDTVKIWQSYVLPDSANNLIVFGEGNYAAGNNQDNVLKAVASNNVIYGGRGGDVFVGNGSTTYIVAQGEGDKVIQNFSEGGDKLRLIGGNLTTFDAVKSAMVQQGSDVVLNDGGTMIAFRNASIGQFEAKDFQLPLNMAAFGAPTFSEDFNSSGTIGANWATNYGYAGTGLNSFTLTNNGEQQIYTSPSFQGTSAAPLGLNPYSFNNGVLTISATPVSSAQSAQMWGYHYSSGMLESNYAQTYGYFEMRAELPHGQGLWPAFWLLGENNKEIDVLEGLGSDTRTANNAIHSPSVPALGNHSYNPYPDGFHTYGLLWNAQTITYYVDQTPVWQVATPADMNSPMRMIVNLAVGGNWPGSPDGSTPWPANMQIDYIRTYGLPDPNVTTPPVTQPVTPPAATLPVVDPGAGQVLTSTYAGATLTGGSGADTLNASQGSDRLTGGAGADSFVFKAMPWSAGHITDFQAGVDKLDLTALYANGYRGADPVADGYVSFVSDGAGGTQVLVDTDGWGSGNTIKFVVATLDGVAPSGLNAANVLGGATTGGTTPPVTGGGQVLTSAYARATLTGGSGADTLNASQGSDRLTGGAGADTFAFKAMPWSAGHITDFQVGVDRLDISGLYAGGYNGASPVADGYVSFVADGAGGTSVLLDTDGWGGGNTLKFQVVTLDGVSPEGLTAANVFNGSGATTTPPASAAGQVLTSPYPGATLTGGAGADTLNASQGSDRLTGGAGADAFAFAKPPWSAGHITDFTPGVDVIDLRGLFTAAGYHGGDPIADGYLSFQSDGAGGTKVMFDQDGWAAGTPWPITVTTLDGVAPASLHSSDWLFH
ncbi:MAG: endo,3,4-beta-glycanase [Phenylobacterium sp.]|nr:endo,3,4-beta-glycanase [Phenylobacterium sp.]